LEIAATWSPAPLATVELRRERSDRSARVGLVASLTRPDRPEQGQLDRNVEIRVRYRWTKTGLGLGGGYVRVTGGKPDDLRVRCLQLDSLFEVAAPGLDAAFSTRLGYRAYPQDGAGVDLLTGRCLGHRHLLPDQLPPIAYFVRRVLYGGTRNLSNALAPWTGFGVLCGYAVILGGLASAPGRRLNAGSRLTPGQI